MKGKKTLNIILLLAYCALIYWLSDQPRLPVTLEFRFGDKLAHILAYAVMGGLAWRAMAGFVPDRSYLWLSTTIFCSLYGMSDEYHQSFVAGRVADIYDWVADSLGAAITTTTLNFRKEDYRTE